MMLNAKDERNNKYLEKLKHYCKGKCDLFEPPVCSACAEAEQVMKKLLQIAKDNKKNY